MISVGLERIFAVLLDIVPKASLIREARTIAFAVNARRGCLALSMACEAAVRSTFIIRQAIAAGGTIGPAFAAPGVAVKASADKATDEAMAIMKMDFMFHLH